MSNVSNEDEELKVEWLDQERSEGRERSKDKWLRGDMRKQILDIGRKEWKKNVRMKNKNEEDWVYE